uniref:Eukaryotic translation initiation factor 2A n=1 Tax=Setaria digitata TaxID=48799 RepID=A0A915Q122_9BILA
MMGENLHYAVRGSDGFGIIKGISSPTSIYDKSQDPKSHPCRVFQFSNTGQYFCYCDTVRTVLVESSTGREIFNVDLPRTQQLVFSPRDRLLATYEPYVAYVAKTAENVEHRQPAPNLRLWSLPDGKHITTLIAQKQNSWKIQWTDDEVYSVRLVGSEILIHKYNSYGNSGMEPHHLAVYVPASGGQPALVQLKRLDHKFTTVASKTLFKCDKINFLWSCKGSAMIVMAILDVDKSNKSYYGEQNLYLVAVNGDSCAVPLEKNGPVYCAKWSPSGKQFAVCYGFMPARVTLYNLKCDPVFDFGEGPRNDMYYNRFGNILILCGFGNIASGRMQFWDVEARREIVTIEAPNTTLLEWAPDGQHLMTATTAPRLRIDNSFRIWHYSGRLLYEHCYSSPSELWQVQWRPVPGNIYHSFSIPILTLEDRAKAGLMMQKRNVGTEHPINNLPVGAVSRNGAYVPPHLRKGGLDLFSSRQNLTVTCLGLTKGALKTSTSSSGPKTCLSEKEKKIRALQKKIDDIEKLKKRKESGEVLEANQVAKIDKENEIVEELEKLKVT